MAPSQCQAFFSSAAATPLKGPYLLSIRQTTSRTTLGTQLIDLRTYLQLPVLTKSLVIFMQGLHQHEVGAMPALCRF